MSIIHYCKKTAPSALALRSRLTQEGYNGPDINFGYSTQVEAQDGSNSPLRGSQSLNTSEAIARASNKRLALKQMDLEHVPIPVLIAYEINNLNQYSNLFPVVGRPDKHSKGRGFWLCHNFEDVRKALRGTRRKAAASHFLQYIEGARDFRVHVLRDSRHCIQSIPNDRFSTTFIRDDTICEGCKYRTIKISEKVREGSEIPIAPVGYAQGARFVYGEISRDDRIKLRKAARGAVRALGLDFGAVDILLKDHQVYVLEVNSAPRLTDETSDTLAKYVEGFMRYWNIP